MTAGPNPFHRDEACARTEGECDGKMTWGERGSIIYYRLKNWLEIMLKSNELESIILNKLIIIIFLLFIDNSKKYDPVVATTKAESINEDLWGEERKRKETLKLSSDVPEPFPNHP